MKKFIYLTFILVFTLQSMAQSAKEFYTSGLIKYHSKRYKEALGDFSKSIKKDTKFFDAYIMKGQCYERMDENKKALKEYSKILKLNPKYVDAYIRRGQLYKKLLETDNAIADFSEALDIKSDPFVRMYRAESYIIIKEWDKAMDDFNKVLKKQPNNVHAKLGIVRIYQLQSKLDTAIQEVTKIITADSNLKEAYLLRAEIYHQQNNNDLACKDLAEAYRLGSAKAEQLIKDWCGSN